VVFLKTWSVIVSVAFGPALHVELRRTSSFMVKVAFGLALQVASTGVAPPLTPPRIKKIPPQPPELVQEELTLPVDESTCAASELVVFEGFQVGVQGVEAAEADPLVEQIKKAIAGPTVLFIGPCE
jgi:hypothetical protein